jgi:hypothetical protein
VVDKALGSFDAHPHNFTSVTTTSTTSHCRTTTPRTTRHPTAIMSDNENGDELVTKPFKFVTGEHVPRLGMAGTDS